MSNTSSSTDTALTTATATTTIDVATPPTPPNTNDIPNITTTTTPNKLKRKRASSSPEQQSQTPTTLSTPSSLSSPSTTTTTQDETTLTNQSTSTLADHEANNNNNGTVIVIHIGSKEIRFGTNEDFIGPQTIENCVAIPKFSPLLITSQQHQQQQQSDHQALSELSQQEHEQKQSKKSYHLKSENLRLNEILRVRAMLLMNRGIIPRDDSVKKSSSSSSSKKSSSKSSSSSTAAAAVVPSEQSNVYFEEITRVSDPVPLYAQQKQQQQRQNSMLMMRRAMNNMMKNPGDQIISGALFGKRAIERVMMMNSTTTTNTTTTTTTTTSAVASNSDVAAMSNDSNTNTGENTTGSSGTSSTSDIEVNQKYELYYPFVSGKLTVLDTQASSQYAMHTTDSLTKSCDLIEAILFYIIKNGLKMNRQQIHDSKLVLILPDECIEQGGGLELKYLLDVVFLRLGFKQALIHKESVSAVYGAGVPLNDICVVDMGETKTTLALVESGDVVSRSELPYGGVHVSKLLLWIMEQCGIPEGLAYSFDDLEDRYHLEQIRNEFCHLDETGAELFQQVDFIHRKMIHTLMLGDPLLLAPLAYFYPKLFGRECKLLEREHNPYLNIASEDLLSSLNAPPTSANDQAAIVEPEAKKPKLEKKGSKKKKSSDKKREKSGTKKSDKKKSSEQSTAQDNEEGSSKSGKGKLKTALALDRAIIRLLKSSKMEVESKAAKKKVISITLLLTGGLSHIKGMKQILERRLFEYYSKKNEGKQIKITILTNDRDKNMDPRFMSWNGGLALSYIESAKKLWINRNEYEMHGMRIVDDKCSFVI